MSVISRRKYGKYIVTRTDKGTRYYDKSGKQVKADVFAAYQKAQQAIKRKAGQKAAKKLKASSKNRIRRSGKFIPRYAERFLRDLGRSQGYDGKALTDWIEQRIQNFKTKTDEYGNEYDIGLKESEWKRLKGEMQVMTATGKKIEKLRSSMMLQRLKALNEGGYKFFLNGQEISYDELITQLTDNSNAEMRAFEDKQSEKGLKLGVDYRIYDVIWDMQSTPSDINITTPGSLWVDTEEHQGNVT